MSYHGTVYCGHCGEKGHNRRGCSQRKRYARENPDSYYAREIKREMERDKQRSQNRKCSYCREGGHNRATCSLLLKDKAHTIKKNKKFCDAFKKALGMCGIGVGALVGNNPKNPDRRRVGMIKEIYWNSGNFATLRSHGGFQVAVDFHGQEWNGNVCLARFPQLVEILAEMLPDFRFTHGTEESRRESHGFRTLSPITAESAQKQVPSVWLQGRTGIDRLYKDWEGKPERRGHISTDYKCCD